MHCLATPGGLLPWMLPPLLAACGSGTLEAPHDDFHATALYPGPCEAITTHADGSTSDHLLFGYDPDGWLVLEELDREPDGVFDAATAYERDDDGRVLLMEIDADLDGIADVVYRYEYDEQGLVTLWEYDGDGDGSWDHSIAYSYDEYGNVTLQQGGDATHRYHNSYDEGLLMNVEYDAFDDGTIERTTDYSYRHDAAGGLLERRLEIAGNDGGVETWSTVEERYDGGGVLLERAADGGSSEGEGGWSQRELYDEAGRLRERCYRNESSVYAELELRDYDHHGNLLETAFIQGSCDEEAEPEFRVSYRYECWG